MNQFSYLVCYVSSTLLLCKQLKGYCHGSLAVFRS